MRNILVMLSFIALILFLSQEASSIDIPLADCGILDETATYILQNDITSDLTCLVAAANNNYN